MTIQRKISVEPSLTRTITTAWRDASLALLQRRQRRQTVVIHQQNEELKWNGQSQSSLVLKLKAPYGTYIRILVNDTAVSMPGYCRGSHPKLYNQADALSLWSRSSSSIFLSRYCTGTERTYDINLCYHLLTLNSCHDLFLFSFDHPLYSLIISFFFL